MLDELKTARKVVGIKQLRKSLKGGQVVRVYLAEDADPRLTDPVRTDCAALGVALVSVPTMAELGKACGISVGAAAAGLLA
ncbi:MAG TPA: ribosomal L7Ae/L30e/S12e/Gadd45 family protein [Candidatus Avoscillospira stercoripullorum]|uniref:Ribosomal L7Ae/L30e/S12e/Gadd45 family protein n=1 Tax=Candidatus Avoscillospira stercoripullorum TaxID=2840709 RepID=A0A9D1D7X7_9FIRM|nr:ribosomal L7Ae/L30e/S12e/Gadd45 family protein [Candidatus Avoscillospira stercoripullorum]